MNTLFVVDPVDAYANTTGLAPGTLAADPERPSVAHVFNGLIAVWATGRNGGYWDQRPATAEQRAAFERAPRVAVVAAAAPPPAAAPTATPPTADAPAVVPASTAALLSTAATAARPNSWENIVATAMRSGLMTQQQMQAALRLIASDSKPAVVPPPKDKAMIDTQAIYAARRQAAANANPVDPDPHGWNAAIARNNEATTLDPAEIYAKRREASAPHGWDKVVSGLRNPQRM